jgi:homoserine dehydrogenase
VSTLQEHRPKRLALLGCGTVGREVAARLLDAGERLGVQLVKVLVRDTSRDRGLPAALFTASIEDIDAAAPDLVIELVGGLEPAADLVARFLGRGIPVVTANKTVIAHRGRELAALAQDHGADLAFEASVCAAIPIIASLRHLAGDRVRSLRGVVNGSTNFILGRLAEGWRFEDALGEARKHGLVEPDPSADVSGSDSAEKLCVLANAAGFPLAPERVETKGIESLTPEDLAAARRSGRTIKLLAELEFADGSVRARVGPTLVPRAHALACVEDEENAVVVETELGGELFLKGRGAGPKPTASAVLGDVARLAGSHARTASSHAAAWPARRHHIRISGRGLAPEQVLGAARSIGVSQINIGRNGARIEADASTSKDAAECAGALGAHSLVMPILEARG